MMELVIEQEGASTWSHFWIKLEIGIQALVFTSKIYPDS